MIILENDRMIQLVVAALLIHQGYACVCVFQTDMNLEFCNRPRENVVQATVLRGLAWEGAKQAGKRRVPAIITKVWGSGPARVGDAIAITGNYERDGAPEKVRIIDLDIELYVPRPPAPAHNVEWCGGVAEKLNVGENVILWWDESEELFLSLCDYLLFTTKISRRDLDLATGFETEFWCDDIYGTYQK
jgi:hypothetical protein